jgi:hypothetical protein
MSEPIVFISRNRVKGGKTDQFRRHYQGSIQPSLSGKPNTFAQLGFENEGGTEFTVVRVFPNAVALDQQIQGADERSKKTYEYIEPTGIFGTPNPATLEKMTKIAGSGIVMSICPGYLGGFIR